MVSVVLGVSVLRDIGGLRNDLLERYLEQAANFPAQLQEFIRITQS